MSLRDLRRRLQEPEPSEEQKREQEQKQRQLQRQAQERAAKLAQAEIEQRKAEAVKKCNKLVMAVLDGLRKAVYARPKSETDYGEPISFVVKDSPDQYQWAMGYEKSSAIGTYFVTLITVTLAFDDNGRPLGFDCERFRESYLEYEGEEPEDPGEPVRARLSRDDLVEALKDLHTRKKRRWFWQR